MFQTKKHDVFLPAVLGVAWSHKMGFGEWKSMDDRLGQANPENQWKDWRSENNSQGEGYAWSPETCEMKFPEVPKPVES